MQTIKEIKEVEVNDTIVVEKQSNSYAMKL